MFFLGIIAVEDDSASNETTASMLHSSVCSSLKSSKLKRV